MKSVQCVLTDGEVEAVLEFFESCLVTRHEKEIKEKLKATAENRHQLVLHAGEKFKLFFDFYFAAPRLV